MERYSVQLATGLQARGLPVSFACRPGEIVDTRCRQANVPTLPWHPRNSGDIGAAFRLASLVVSKRVDIVHVHSRRDFLPALVGVAAARFRLQRRRRPLLILHAHLLRPLGTSGRRQSRLWTRNVDAVLAVSAAVRERLQHDHEFPPGFVRLLHNGVEIERFAPPGSPEALALRRAAREAWNVPPEAPTIGMVGRLDAKGQAQLLQVLPALLERFPALRVVLVGAEGAPGERERLSDMARTQGAGQHLVFTGPQEDVPALLPGFDVLAHLPTDEAFGLAPVEAMAAGLPVVATDIGGCREVVREELSGLLAPPDDDAALLNALSRLLSDPDGAALRTRLGLAGRRIVEADFSLPRQIDRLQELYAQLCQTTPP